MSAPRTISLSLAAVAIAALSTTPFVGTANAAPATASGSSTGNLLGTLAYRGAEHPYLVGNTADAVKRFGPGSAQANASQAGLSANDKALAGLIAGSSATKQKAIVGGLGLRDREELSYASDVVAAKASGATSTTTAEKQVLASLGSTAGTMAKAIHTAIPSVSVSSAENAIDVLNRGDESALKQAALNETGQFAAVEKGSIASATLMTALGAKKAIGSKLSGTTSSGIPRAVVYRAALETSFTEHVYQTGLFGQAILLNGPRSAAAAAARKAENTNTANDAKLLGDLGTGTSHTQAVWNTHITGYGDYLTNLSAGDATLAKPASTLLASYESAITSLVKKAVPSLNTSSLRSSYDEHVTGTLAVFRAEKAGSATTYPMALMGAHHFSDLATTIANAQTEIKN